MNKKNTKSTPATKAKPAKASKPAKPAPAKAKAKAPKMDAATKAAKQLGGERKKVTRPKGQKPATMHTVTNVVAAPVPTPAPVAPAPVAPAPTPAPLAPPPPAPAAAPAPAAKGKRYQPKTDPTSKYHNRERSTVTKPVDVVRQIFAANHTKTRKEIIALCLAKGVNKHTAATQYSLARAAANKAAAAKK